LYSKPDSLQIEDEDVMPELPDLEVIREYLAPRLPGATITSAVVRRPIIVRNLLGDDFAGHVDSMTGPPW
jgi:formamidopyrimidine-DNA glycosylase